MYSSNSLNSLNFIKIVSLIEIALILLLLIIAYVAFFYYSQKRKQNPIKKDKIKRRIIKLSQQKSPHIAKEVNKFKKNLPLLLEVLPSIETLSNIPFWPQVKLILIETILKKSARKLATSRSFSKRYLAVECYRYGTEISDDKILVKLIEDGSLLISLNAALIAVKRPGYSTVKALINFYSKGRRLQQTLFSDKLTAADISIIPFVVGRLITEENPYIKIFCYRILSKLPSTNKIISTVERDLKDPHTDLKISVLSYLAKQSRHAIPTIREHLTDKQWEVRVVAIKLLCQVMDEKSITTIGQLLKDSEWWVRVNAAQALSKMGNKGIEILKAQDPKLDRYAYEVAEHVLLTLQNDNK